MCLSNNATLFQTKGGISDGALRVTYYDSRGIVSYNFIFHVADPIATNASMLSESKYLKFLGGILGKKPQTLLIPIYIYILVLLYLYDTKQNCGASSDTYYMYEKNKK